VKRIKLDYYWRTKGRETGIGVKNLKFEESGLTADEFRSFIVNIFGFHRVQPWSFIVNIFGFHRVQPCGLDHILIVVR